MNDRTQLTPGEVEALNYIQGHGAPLPAWLTAEGANYYRPNTFTPEQFSDFARTLEIYNTYLQAQKLDSIRRWVKFFGILTIIGIILAILF